jgi:hypothetical protein
MNLLMNFVLMPQFNNLFALQYISAKDNQYMQLEETKLRCKILKIYRISSIILQKVVRHSFQYCLPYNGFAKNRRKGTKGGCHTENCKPDMRQVILPILCSFLVAFVFSWTCKPPLKNASEEYVSEVYYKVIWCSLCMHLLNVEAQTSRLN